MDFLDGQKDVSGGGHGRAVFRFAILAAFVAVFSWQRGERREYFSPLLQGQVIGKRALIFLQKIVELSFVVKRCKISDGGALNGLCSYIAGCGPYIKIVLKKICRNVYSAQHDPHQVQLSDMLGRQIAHKNSWVAGHPMGLGEFFNQF